MSRRITIVAATVKEIQPFAHFLSSEADQHSFQTFHYHGTDIDLLYSGIGIMQTTYTLTDYISHRHPDGWIQAGIGGSFDPAVPVGDLRVISSEVLVDFGAEEQDGHIRNAFELGWNDPNRSPYQDGLLICPYAQKAPFENATGMTVMHATGNAAHIEHLKKGMNGQIENMEGFPFYYISLLHNIPFLSLRSVSNVVEPRDVSRWKIEEAITVLNDGLIEFLRESDLNPDKLFVRG